MIRSRTVRTISVGVLIATVAGTVAASCWAYWPKWQESRQIDELINGLQVENGYKQLDAIKGLNRVGPAAVPHLISALSHPNWRTRYGAAIALGRIGPVNDRVIPALVVAFKDQNEFVSMYAIRSVGWMDEDAKGAIPDLIEAFNDNERYVRYAAERAMGRMGAEAIPPMIEVLCGKGASRRVSAARALREFGPEAKPAVPALITALQDDDLSVRSAAMIALRQIGPDAKAAVPSLIVARQEKDHDIAYQLPATANSALRKIDPDTFARLTADERAAAKQQNVGLSDGLFFTKLPNQPGNSMKAIDQNGKVIEISLDPGPEVKRSYVYAVDNQNAQYIATVIIEGIPDRSLWLALCVGGECFTTIGSGGTSDKTTQVSFRGNPEQADRIAAFLKVPRLDRMHPGHKLRGEFVPSKNAFQRGEDIGVTLRLTNVGDVPIVYAKGGDYHSEIQRCNRFSFRIYFDGKLKKDITSADSGGGMVGRPSLKPDDTDTIEENLLNWGTFSRPGKYEVHCRYRLDLQIPRPRESVENMDHIGPAQLQWDDAAEQVIEIVVLE